MSKPSRAERLAAEKAQRRLTVVEEPPREPVVCLARDCRVALGLTLEEVAEEVGLSVSGLQKIETGVSKPVLDTARRIAGFFGTPIEKLWPETAEAKP